MLSVEQLQLLELMPVKREYRAAFQALLEFAQAALQMVEDDTPKARRNAKRWEALGVGLYGENLRLPHLFVSVYAYEGVMSLGVSLEKFVRKAPTIRPAEPEDHAALLPEAKRQAVELAKTLLRDALSELDEVDE
jgi:hypothetical protein